MCYPWINTPPFNPDWTGWNPDLWVKGPMEQRKQDPWLGTGGMSLPNDWIRTGGNQ
jgi:hypothetical protein